MIYENNSPELGNMIDRDRFAEEEYNDLFCEYCGRDYRLYKVKSGEIICRECLAEWLEANDLITEV